jgi:hypothetical protein
VFLSYRRDVSSATAKLVRDHLVRHGFDVFIDTASLGGGAFTTTLLGEIAARPHFVLLLEPRSLDGVHDEGDWLRREVAHALATGRNVVPMTTGSTPMPAADALPPDIAALAGYNALPAPWAYFDEALIRLREQFLVIAHVPVNGLDEPPTAGDLRVGRYNTLLVVSWPAVPGAEYELQSAGDIPGARMMPVYRGTARRYTTPLARTSSLVRYRVRGTTRLGGTGAWSKPVQIPPPPPPEAPFVVVRFGMFGAKVTWEPVPAAQSYEVQCSVGTGFTTVIRAERVWLDSYADRRGKGGTHAYRVRAVFDRDRLGPWSEPAFT